MAFLASVTLLLAVTAILAPALTIAFQSNQQTTPSFLPDIKAFFLTSTQTPPPESLCNSFGFRCFAPAAMAGSYNYAGLHASGDEGQGKTIALVDSYGSASIASDLNVFNTEFGLPHMCGETSVTCTSGMPTFKILQVQGSPAPKCPPPTSKGTGLEDKCAWAGEVSLDVEWAHATAPLANILLVTTPTAETLGVQGLQQMMHAIQQVVDNHQADVVSMSFSTGEEAFNGGLQGSIKQLRQAFIDAQANDVTLFSSSGDGGTANSMKTPVKNPNLIPYPSVGWPASDPLVTGVGGTSLCTDTTTGTTIDTISPPTSCESGPRETGWTYSGGGYSILFSRPTFQDVLPPGSSYVGSSVGAPGPNVNMRGVPDIAYQADPNTGVLVYLQGWYTFGGTSSGSPQWAGIIAMADQIAGRDLGYINPALYQIALNPVKYAADFFDVTTGCNQAVASIPGYCASTGWDAVTGLGTPNVANLIPDLIAAT